MKYESLRQVQEARMQHHAEIMRLCELLVPMQEQAERLLEDAGFTSGVRLIMTEEAKKTLVVPEGYSQEELIVGEVISLFGIWTYAPLAHCDEYDSEHYNSPDLMVNIHANGRCGYYGAISIALLIEMREAYHIKVVKNG